MEIKVIEESDEKLKIQVEGGLTLVNLLNENLWKQRGLDYAAFAKEHPIAEPILLVKSKNPKKALLEAADRIVEDVKDVRKQFERELKD